MIESRSAAWVLRLLTGVTLGFIYIPLVVIVLYAFNSSTTTAWPIEGLTVDWFGRAANSSGLRAAFLTSLQAALGATAIALLLGTLAAFAVHRFSFFGREAISFLVILPLALPGIVTGMALNATFRSAGVPFGLLTIVVGHATFCVVVVYNNVIARLRRGSRSIEEASMDLGATPFQTFRHVTFPAIRSALLAGALLAFALSFDEVIVTTFTSGSSAQTIPIWILTVYNRPNNLPLVNVAAVALIVLSIVPVYLAQRLAGTESATIR